MHGLKVFLQHELGDLSCGCHGNVIKAGYLLLS